MTIGSSQFPRYHPTEIATKNYQPRRRRNPGKMHTGNQEKKRSAKGQRRKKKERGGKTH